MPVKGDYECFSDDWRRTNPDLVFFLPKQPPEWVEAVDHVLVDVTPGGDLLAIWTYGTKADASDHTVLYARARTAAARGPSRANSTRRAPNPAR